MTRWWRWVGVGLPAHLQSRRPLTPRGHLPQPLPQQSREPRCVGPAAVTTALTHVGAALQLVRLLRGIQHEGSLCRSGVGRAGGGARVGGLELHHKLLDVQQKLARVSMALVGAACSW